MLILTRRIEEGITIGDDIKIVILGIDRNTVKIGIDAPKNLKILRDDAVVTTPKDGSTNV
jgi:carbon storage regulator